MAASFSAAARRALSTTSTAAAFRALGIQTTARLSHPLRLRLLLARGGAGALPSRPFSSPTAPDAALLEVIDSEIKYAQESDIPYSAGEVPERFPFDMKDERGSSVIVLTRDFDSESIEIVASMPNLITGEASGGGGDDDGNADGPAQSSIPLTVKCSKGSGVSMEFHCTAFPDEVCIDSMSVRRGGDSDIPYEGPEFSELDENLQKSFRKYLEIRGISPANINFLHEYMINKDSREYSVWLKNLKAFLN